MTTRAYKDSQMQFIYALYRATPPIRDGIRDRGGSHRVSFWDGVDGKPRIPHRQSAAFACYMAGKDSRDDPIVKAARLSNIGPGIYA